MVENSMKPRIRFKGYTDAWEQRKFNSIAKRVTEMAAIEGLPRVEYEDIVSGQGTLNKDIYRKQSGKVGILFDNGDVLFGKLRPYLKNWLFASFKGIAVGDFWVLRAENADGQYIYTLLQIDAFQNVANQSTGTKMPRADWSLVSKQQFVTPRIIAEQRKIGMFFKQLDNLITLHQRKYDKIVNIKKALLEKMFPSDAETTPKIRFKGFTDAWEQRKLGDDAEELLAGGDIDKDLICENGSYPVIANALTNDGIVGFYENYYRVKAPAVTVTGRGDVGHAQARNVNFTPVVRLLSIKSSHNVDFLENAINRGEVIVESTGVPQLTVPQLSKRMISFPQTVSEEEKIGRLFFKIDNLITLHQRQLEKLKNIKSALLEKMFV